MGRQFKHLGGVAVGLALGAAAQLFETGGSQSLAP